MDTKGRIILPAALRKQLPQEDADRLVINRGFDKCLVLYTRKDWDKETEKLSSLNSFNKKDRLFLRLFNNGATELLIDTSSRILIPKKLQEYAELDNDLILFAYSNKIEVWSKKLYDEHLEIDADSFAALAEELMSGKSKEQGGDDE